MDYAYANFQTSNQSYITFSHVRSVSWLHRHVIDSFRRGCEAGRANCRRAPQLRNSHWLLFLFDLSLRGGDWWLVDHDVAVGTIYDNVIAICKIQAIASSRQDLATRNHDLRQLLAPCCPSLSLASSCLLGCSRHLRCCDQRLQVQDAIFDFAPCYSEYW